MSRLWVVGVALIGLVLVAVIYACIRSAAPNGRGASDWAIFGPLLFGPYALASLGCGLSRSWLVRVPAVLTVLTGALIATVAVLDAWPTFHGGPAPAMPASALTSGVLLTVQFWASCMTALVGFADRSVSRGK